jgi:hypothetical protein
MARWLCTLRMVFALRLLAALVMPMLDCKGKERRSLQWVGFPENVCVACV